jgi:hypothetical protein
MKQNEIVDQLVNAANNLVNSNVCRIGPFAYGIESILCSEHDTDKVLGRINRLRAAIEAYENYKRENG